MIRVIEEISAADGSAGWTLMIGVEVLGVAFGYLDADLVRDLLVAEPNLIAAGAVNPLGRAERVDGGWRVSGRWPFASGVHNSQYFWGGCMIDSQERPRPTLQAWMPASEIQIIDTWSVSGLQGTGSHDVEVSDVFVSDGWVSNVLGGKARVDSPMFRMPLMSRFAFNKVGVATGIARAAIDDFVHLATEKVPVGGRERLCERPRAQEAVADAEATLCSARAWVFDVVQELWGDALEGRRISDELHARVRLSCSHAAESAAAAVDIVHKAAGSTVNFLGAPLERRFRDVHVVPQHITVAPHLKEAAGRVMLGLDPGVMTFR